MFLDRRLIIFDLDGTLIDSLGIWSRVDCVMVERLSGFKAKLTPEEAFERRLRALKTYGESSQTYFLFCQELKEAFNLPGTREEIHATRYAIAQELLATEVAYRPGAPDVLKALKAAGLKLAIATTTRRSNIEVYRTKNASILAAAPLDDYFDAIYTRDDVTQVKPHPEVYERLLAQFGVKPQEALVLEDAIAGMKGAKAAGIESIVITEPHAQSEWDEANTLATLRVPHWQAVLQMIEAEAASGLGTRTQID